MASRNADSMTNAQGEFHPSKPRDEPLTTTGHQPGQKFSEKDQAPEFSAQTLPAGSAPADKTYEPNPSSDTTVPGQADNQAMLAEGKKKEATYTSATETLGGTDSAQGHTGLGHPGSGMTSSELKHDGKHGTGPKRDGAGLEGVGGNSGNQGMNDPKFNP